MSNLKYISIATILLLTTLLHTTKASQTLPLQKTLPKYNCVNYAANIIKYPGDSSKMEQFYKKLDSLAMFGKGHINIIHIGGSHVQADVMTHQLRLNITNMLPGMASDRGLLFPFRAAKTNNPSNYKIEYTGKWTKCQNSLPPINRVLGISGIAISTDDNTASVSFNLNPDTTTLSKWQFNRLQLIASVNDTTFTPILIIDNDSIAPTYISHDCTLTIDTIHPIKPNITTYYTYYSPYSADHGKIVLCHTNIIKQLQQKNIVKYSHNYTTNLNNTNITNNEQNKYQPSDSLYNVNNNSSAHTDSLEIGLESDNKLYSVQTTNQNSQNNLFTINGFLPYSDENGIVVHSIGVNGASLASWLRCSEFEHQMHMIKPDLVLLAVGVNDANVPYGKFDSTAYIANYNRILEQIYKTNPNCAVIFMTNNDCVLRTGRHSHGANKNSPLVVSAMNTLAQKHGAGLWNLYEIMGGLGSMAVWRDNGLGNKDRVHFLAPGYRLLGDMLYNAIIFDWLYKPKAEKQ